MIDMKEYRGFALLKGDTSLEASRLSLFCKLQGIPLIVQQPNILFEDYVPSGSVEWCEYLLQRTVTPDYYPEWLQSYLHRKVWKEDKWVLGRKLFVKPADRYKRFTGFVTTGSYSKKKKGQLIWSDIIQFENEWRYYITKGKVLSGDWYWGDEINTPLAPKLDIDIPKDYCGALDFGMTKYGLALIESQHPFSCGWYGPRENDHLYFQWLIDGWDYMREYK